MFLFNSPCSSTITTGSSILFSDSNSIPTEPSQSSFFLLTFSSTNGVSSSSYTKQHTSEWIEFLLKQQLSVHVVIKNKKGNTSLFWKFFGC
ncbi:unnamed protein product [Rotaria sp. Silwood2]|nr:unnamed protein product [Rotaria sp. Silwood2]CAF2852098.1 unnamed protein product [Rotaria sp. Silwood2]CAF3092213.1 unnamed protein product [Rotaria sp. Silwood2]CAF4141572.1 unnamed protein product [Rotaria sp. Silwood2]CAF4206859.1 unnamed protein product [Rotaria sp. Silwood2]